MKIALTDRMLPIEAKIPCSTLETTPAYILPKAFLPFDPAFLQDLDQDAIEKLVPTSALKGAAIDGGPKWSWVDAWGFRWEIRFHPYPNVTFPSRPSGCGSTIRFGMQIVPDAFGYEEILSMDRSLVEKFGMPSQWTSTGLCINPQPTRNNLSLDCTWSSRGDPTRLDKA
jgi:hypothetical protein